MRPSPELVDLLSGMMTESRSALSPVEARLREEDEARRLEGVVTRPAPESVEWIDVATDDPVPVPLRIYTPKDPCTQPRAAIVYAHGGGWSKGSPTTAHTHTAALCADADVVVVSVDYRLIPEQPYPAGLDDVESAFLWTHRNASSLGVDPLRIAIAGSSAGGNLAAAATRRLRDHGRPTPALQLLEAAALSLHPDSPSWDESRKDLPPLASMLEQALADYRAAGASAGDPEAAPLSGDDFAGLPRTVLVVGEVDSLRSDSVRYAELLAAAGVATELHFVPGIIHGTENFVQLVPGARDWHRVCVKAIREHLKASEDPHA